ncbi:hypothetical protein SAMN05518672_103306 [Chitinophaga sp. CF118]|uniref:hypothetical protein n=1 Tax=Chitinophaga sp. CF118 TaxID=1884367 RepID=UPI0008E8255E|nr:hypothetical protein [Chitinophaga sp. CF118]SFD81006.1 hypothetical protein SAMN05518672_103306 [Chitinophaga sp. CF118]
MPDIFMKQPFICLVALSLFFAACKKDETSTTPVTEPVTKYVQSIISDAGDSTALEYNMDKSLYRYITYGTSEEITAAIPSYDAGNVVKIEKATGANLNEIFTRQIISYNTLVQVTKIKFYNYDGSFSHSDSLYYGTGKLDTIYQYEYNTELEEKLVIKYAYTWDAKGNIIKLEKIYLNNQGENGTTVTTYTYDDKQNPALQIKGYYVINFDEDEVPGLLSANNIISSSSLNTTNGYTASTRNTYGYDEDKYPATMTLRSMSQYTGQELLSDSVTLKINYGK